MNIYQRAYREADQDAVLQLLLETRIGPSLERYPTFWRLRQELATRLWEPEQDARIWEGAGGKVLAVAALVSRAPDALSRHIEYIIHSQVDQREILTEILVWADMRVLEKSVQHRATYAITISHDPDQKERSGVPEADGYILNKQTYNLYMSCPLARSQILPPEIEGFALRALDGLHELEGYMELFGFAAMTVEHRHELLAHPDEYAHIVAATPDDRLVGYCEVSISRQEWARQPRRIGWVDYIGTREEFQRRGLGHALLLHGLRCLQDWGAEQAMLITMGSNTTAQRAFKSVGFLAAEQSFFYKKQIEA